MIFIQSYRYSHGTYTTTNYLVNATIDKIPLLILTGAALVIANVEQDDLFKLRAGYTVIPDVKALESIWW